MSRQENNLVRTPQDLERKYDFSGLIKKVEKNYELQKLGLNKVENELTNFANATTKNLGELQNQSPPLKLQSRSSPNRRLLN